MNRLLLELWTKQAAAATTHPGRCSVAFGLIWGGVMVTGSLIMGVTVGSAVAFGAFWGLLMGVAGFIGAGVLGPRLDASVEPDPSQVQAGTEVSVASVLDGDHSDHSVG